ncbi:MAG: type II toxin-antitoxin system HicA family toxin [Methanosarcinales archaeon Met12]|nr:MAG: type II toxin-antitoxin system HicA family toxin [Methanosarcinales archaeon Met12]
MISLVKGYSIEEALKNLKEASELFIDTMGLPDDIKESDTIIARFEVGTHEKLPVLSGRELIKILAKIGFSPVRQKGSHIILVNETNLLNDMQFIFN